MWKFYIFLKKLFKTFLFQTFALVFTIITLGITYAAWTTLTASQWASGQPVNQTLVQGIINNINDLDARINNIASISGWIGSWQTWQDMTLSRSMNTTYTNTTGKPISVNIIAGAPGPGASTASLYIDGIVVDYYTTNGYNGWLQWIVPPGSTYRVSGGNITFSLGIPYWWKELR